MGCCPCVGDIPAPHLTAGRQALKQGSAAEHVKKGSPPRFGQKTRFLKEGRRCPGLTGSPFRPN
jgi:hypothetical protein